MRRSHASRLISQGLAAALLVLALPGCQSVLLPRSSQDTPTGFASYQDAEAAALRVVARQTRTNELKGLGFDPIDGTNVTMIPYPQIVARLAPYPGVPVERLDPGIQECINSQTACRGYLFHFERQDRKREGPFLLDFLNVIRTTYVTGWWFEALIVVSDGTVLFRNYGGQATTDRKEKQVNPLGPFQPAGEAAGYALIR
jgi:hypothetical protein